MMSDKALAGLVRIAVSARAHYMCEYPTCGALCFLENHHAVSQKNLAAKYDPDCCVLLCSRHHAIAEKNRKALVSILINAGVRPRAWEAYLDDKKRMLIADETAYKKQMEAKVRGLLSDLKIKV